MLHPHPGFVLHVCIAESPRITTHSQELKDAVPGKPVKFTLQATGTEPLNFHWQWKPAGEEDGSIRSGSHVLQSGLMVLH